MAIDGLENTGSTMLSSLDVEIVEEQTGSYLCCEQTRRKVDAAEFRAWAAYSGIDVQPLAMRDGFRVILRDKAQTTLFRSEWLNRLDEVEPAQTARSSDQLVSLRHASR